MTESKYFDFRAEFFNATNHPSYGAPRKEYFCTERLRDHYGHRQRAANPGVCAEVPLLIGLIQDRC